MTFTKLDFSRFASSDSLERAALSKELVAALKDHGAVKLINFGVSEEIVKGFLKLALEYFSLSNESKMAAANEPGPNPQRGYSLIGQEKVARLLHGNVNSHPEWAELRDAREHFDIGPPNDTQFPNKWPSEDHFPHFRQMMESTWLEFQKAAIQITRAVEEGLSLSSGALMSRCESSPSEMRLNHYPEISVEALSEGKTKRIWPHADLGIITLLFQDHVGGLEVQDRLKSSPGENAFMTVPPPNHDGPCEVMILVGETLERLTNGAIMRCIHQVSPPLLMKNDTAGICPERYSSAFFLKADKNASVGPLPDFVEDGQASVYDEVSALAFQQRRVAKLY